MNVTYILAQVAAAGVTLKPLPSGKIWAEPSARLTDDLRALIRQHKAELLSAVIPSPEAQAELIKLVNRVSDFHGFTAEQRKEALEIALSDHERALICFRALVAEIPVPPKIKG